jgi:adenylate cyclase
LYRLYRVVPYWYKSSTSFVRAALGKLMTVQPATSPYLLLEAGNRRFPLADALSWAVGRGEGCAVMLDSRSVSRLHALIQKKDEGDFCLVDLGSRNGSFVNARRVSVPQVLKDADRLTFGDQELLFRTPVSSSPAVTSAVGTGTRNEPTTALHTHSLTTIAVVDIRDFTRFTRSVSEALLSQAIGTWFLRVGQIAQRHGSWAQKYVGDAVMAVWVHDETTRMGADLLRALQAVSEIDTVTSELHQVLPLPSPWRVGAGVNTGSAIVGGSDYTALGDTVNAAFRLETATKTLGMGVALGERTFSELKLPADHPFVQRQVDLKGYESPSTAWAISFEDLRRFLKTPR